MKRHPKAKIDLKLTLRELEKSLEAWENVTDEAAPAQVPSRNSELSARTRLLFQRLKEQIDSLSDESEISP